ncbi:MAG: hypothetical protein MHPSP_000077 [Paramarteilia canceri]
MRRWTFSIVCCVLTSILLDPVKSDLYFDLDDDYSSGVKYEEDTWASISLVSNKVAKKHEDGLLRIDSSTNTLFIKINTDLYYANIGDDFKILTVNHFKSADEPITDMFAKDSTLYLVMHDKIAIIDYTVSEDRQKRYPKTPRPASFDGKIGGIYIGDNFMYLAINSNQACKLVFVLLENINDPFEIVANLGDEEGHCELYGMSYNKILGHLITYNKFSNELILFDLQTYQPLKVIDKGLKNMKRLVSSAKISNAHPTANSYYIPKGYTLQQVDIEDKSVWVMSYSMNVQDPGISIVDIEALNTQIITYSVPNIFRSKHVESMQHAFNRKSKIMLLVAYAINSLLIFLIEISSHTEKGRKAKIRFSEMTKSGVDYVADVTNDRGSMTSRDKVVVETKTENSNLKMKSRGGSSNSRMKNIDLDL